MVAQSYAADSPGRRVTGRVLGPKRKLNCFAAQAACIAVRKRIRLWMGGYPVSVPVEEGSVI